ncbi:hypothetical protein BHE74_00045603 [Ensete ventricosum]|nr:hypothetical protein GW17_00016031 [Ensete ventricosum]RWW48328.1 hypothetical protein BHE74_00045603 [Ensete ventricosum]
MMTAAQISLLFRPLPSPSLSRPPERLFHSAMCRPAAFLIPSHLHKSRFHRRPIALGPVPHALPPDNSDPALEPSFPDKDSSLDSQASRGSQLSQETGGESSRGGPDAAAVVGAVGNGASFVEKSSVEKTTTEGRFRLMVFLMGALASARKGLDAVLMSEWLSWWPFWRKEHRLEWLIADADANPRDVAKQSALLAELNKHRFSCGNLHLSFHLFCYLNCFSFLLLAVLKQLSDALNKEIMQLIAEESQNIFELLL